MMGWRVATLLVGAVLLSGGTARAQQATAASKFGKVLLGGAAGLGIHEAGHLVADWAFEEKVVIKKVNYKSIPFFALSHAPDLSPRREYVVSAAGMWSQYLFSEQILTHHPNLKDERSPFRKGMLTFHVITSMIYAGAALGKTGPIERDTRGMAVSRRLDERWIGVLVLAPALLDAVRFFNPDADWAAWASRGTKIGSVALTLK